MHVDLVAFIASDFKCKGKSLLLFSFLALSVLLSKGVGENPF